jgi:hypothetical protein
LHIEFLVEELSAKEALQNLLPIILGEDITFDIHPYGGKRDLLAKLPARLKGYSAWLPPDRKIVVLIDGDNEDCFHLKDKLEKIAASAGLSTKSSVPENKPFQILSRLAIEELEAWFFGDVKAIVSAYPGVSRNLAKQVKFRNPDAISGGTWEALERVLQKAGHHQGGLEKLRAAREISKYMTPKENRSQSFQIFHDGLEQMMNVGL